MLRVNFDCNLWGHCNTLLENVSVQCTPFKFELKDSNTVSWNKSISIETLQKSEWNLLDDILHDEKCGLLNGKRRCLNYQKYKAWKLSKFIFFSKDKCEKLGRSTGSVERVEPPLLFFGNRKKNPDLERDALILFIYELNFSFKMRLHEFVVLG